MRPPEDRDHDPQALQHSLVCPRVHPEVRTRYQGPQATQWVPNLEARKSQQGPSYAGGHSLAPAPPGACGQRQAGTGLLLMETWPLISFLCAPPGQSQGTGGGEGGWP